MPPRPPDCSALTTSCEARSADADLLLAARSGLRADGLVHVRRCDTLQPAASTMLPETKAELQKRGRSRAMRCMRGRTKHPQHLKRRMDGSRLCAQPSHYPCPAGLYKEAHRHLMVARHGSNFTQHRADVVLRAVMRLAVPSCGATTCLLHGCRRLVHRCAPGRVSTAVPRPRMSAAPSTAAASSAAAIGPGPPPPPPLAAGSGGSYAAFIPGFLHWVGFCNNGAAAAAAGEFLGLSVDGKTVGYLKPRCDGAGRAHARCGHRPQAQRHCPAACLRAACLPAHLSARPPACLPVESTLSCSVNNSAPAAAPLQLCRASLAVH